MFPKFTELVYADHWPHETGAGFITRAQLHSPAMGKFNSSPAKYK